MDDYTFDPNATWATGAEMPEDDTDLRDAATVRTPLEAIGDNTAILGARFAVATSQRIDMTPHQASFDGTAWTWGYDGIVNASLTAATNQVVFPLVGLPHGASILNVRAQIDPPGGHGGGLPGNMPRLLLDTIDSTGAITNVETVIDGTSAGGYETAHQFQAAANFNGGAGHTYSRRKSNVSAVSAMQLRFVNESGANSFVGLKLLFVGVTFSVPFLPVGV